jgi:POT family proton-dependent oligopeptide transporter
MFERLGFYVLSYLLVLYAKASFGFSDAQAFGLYAIFTGLAYLATAIGGYLADHVFGIRRCMILGLLFESIGLLLLAAPQHFVFPIALAFIISGVGLYKTTPTHLLGRSYSENDPRIDSGFTLYYMFMNLGPLAGSLVIGFIQRYYGWHAAFIFGGIVIAASLLSYFLLRKSAQEVDSSVGQKSLPIKSWLSMGVGVIVAVGACTFFMMKNAVAYDFYTIAGLGLLGYYIYEIIRSTKEDRSKIIGCMILILMGFIFFVLYQQAYTSIVLFIDRSVDRTLFGFQIPTSAFFGLNPLWVIALGPLLAWVYNVLGRKGKDLAITLKFPIGLLITTLCFFSLRIGGAFAESSGLVSAIWVVLAYMFYTLGEMLVSALGVAMVTHIAPKRMYGVMMGTWYFVGMSLSAVFSGKFASIASIPATLQDQFAILHIYNHAFLNMGLFSLIFVGFAFLVGPYVKRLIAVSEDKSV